MKPKTAKRLIAAAIIAAVLTTALILRRPSVPEYEITDLGLLSQFGYVSAMNNKGQVVGWTQDPNGQSHAFIWNPVDGKKLIPIPDRRSSIAYDINDKGQVVGELYFTGKNRSAFIWDREAGITELNTLDEISSVPTAVNNNGQVAGWIEDSAGKTHAFFWDKTNGMQDLETLGGPESIANDINDKGQVVGLSHIASGQVHAFIWDQPNGMVDMAPHWIWSYANAINNSGKVLGRRTKKNGYCLFIWQKSEVLREVKLPHKGATITKANDSGQVIGFFVTEKFLFFKSRKYFFLWDPEKGFFELDSISRLGGFFEAHDINNKGQIIGTQSKPGQDHVIILTPKAKQ